MAITFNQKSLIPHSYQVLAYPMLFLLVISFLIIIILKIGLSEISKQRDQLSSINKNINVLTAKETTLKEVQGSAVSQVDSAVSAVPAKNPLLVVISQIKNVSAQNGLTISKIEAGGVAKSQSGLSTADIGFSIQGDISSILTFIKSIASASPLTTIEKINLSQSSGASLAEISLKIYWAPFPTKITSEIEPLSTLSSSEQKTLAKLQGLQAPPYTELQPSLPLERSNPFNF